MCKQAELTSLYLRIIFPVLQCYVVFSLFDIQGTAPFTFYRLSRLNFLKTERWSCNVSDQSFLLKISVNVFPKDIVASQRPIKNINTLIVAAYFYLQFPTLSLESFSIYDPMQQYLTQNTDIPPRVFHFKGNLNFCLYFLKVKTN